MSRLIKWLIRGNRGWCECGCPELAHGRRGCRRRCGWYCTVTPDRWARSPGRRSRRAPVPARALDPAPRSADREALPDPDPSEVTRFDLIRRHPYLP